MRDARLWRALMGVEKRVVIERVEMGQDDVEGGDVVTVHVRVARRGRGRCGVCQRRCPGYDSGHGRRRWRAPDLGTVRAFVEAPAPRVSCPEHGVVVAQVPWARHDAGHAYAFDDTVAWLAVRCSKSAVAQLLRIAWRTVGSILTRVADEAMQEVDRFAGVRRIGIDEVSYKKGHRYLTVVVDHDTRAVIWAGAGRDKATLRRFFDELGPDRCALITQVSADAADWISAVVTERCPNAVRCADPFHVVAWATEALDEVRRQSWNRARGAVTQRRAGRASGDARALKHARYALWKNPEDLTPNQTGMLAWIA